MTFSYTNVKINLVCFLVKTDRLNIMACSMTAILTGKFDWFTSWSMSFICGFFLVQWQVALLVRYLVNDNYSVVQ